MRLLQTYLVLFLYTVEIHAQLNGTYTIGGTNPNYPTIDSAVTDLELQGVSGPVTFNIRDGIYNEQIQIGPIIGASSANKIAFQSENSDSSAVIIVFNSDSIKNYTIKIDSASFITIKMLTIQAVGSNYNRVVQFINGSHDNNFLNCRILGVYNGNGDMVTIGAVGDFYNDSNNIFINNLFENGGNGIWIEGSNDYESGIYFENNVFLNQTHISIFINQANSPKFSNNKVIRLQPAINSGFQTGIWMQNSSSVLISNNTVLIAVDSTSAEFGDIDVWGLVLMSCTGNQNQKNLISNNVINIQNNNVSDSVSVGAISIYTQGNTNTNIYYNTASVVGTPGLMNAFKFDLCDNCNAINNIFAVFANCTFGCYAVGINSSTNSSMNYNDIYTLSPNLLRVNNNYIATLSDWQQFGYDTNSISLDPLFTDSLLHVQPYSPVCARGIFLPEVTEDIEGNLRKNPPTIGAYEIDSCEVSVTELHETPDGLFSLFPNPAQNEVSIFVNTKAEKIELEIYSIDGKKILSKNSLNSTFPFHFDVSKWANGIYYCRVKDGNNYSMKRFAVVK